MFGRSRFSLFITSNNSWILLSCIVFICFRWVMTLYDFGTVMYLHQAKWVLFFDLLACFLLVFWPLLLFAMYRRWIRDRVGGLWSKVLWSVIFILYPICIGLFVDLAGEIPVGMVSEMVTIIGLALASVDLLTSGALTFPANDRWKSWAEGLSLERIVAAGFVVLAFYSAIHLRQMSVREISLVSLFIWALIPAGLYYAFYRVNHYYLVEVVYRERGLVYYAFGFLGLMVLFFVPLVAAYYYLPGHEVVLRLRLGENWIGPDAPFTFYSMYVGTVTAPMILTIPLTILIQWLQQRGRISALQNENAQTELALLKHQINPHFFFNTLNNIHALTLTKDPMADESILQLSDLMRYVIYKGKEDKVTLAEEIKYIEDYVKLQLIRVQVPVDFRFTKHIPDPTVMVPPLLFIILVENAIKHGVEVAEKNALLHIDIRKKDEHIVLGVRNSVEGNSTEGDGVGLDNLRRRLGLLYPDRYTLDCHLSEGIHTATLVLYHEVN